MIYRDLKNKNLMPKAARNPKNANPAIFSDFVIRISSGFRPSDFGSPRPRRLLQPPLTQVLLISVLMVTPALGSTNPPSPQHVEVPIKMRQGDLLVETRVNGSKPLWFKLDTGFGVTTLHPDLAE